MQSIEPLIIKTHKAAVALRNCSDKQIKKALNMLADVLEGNAAIIFYNIAVTSKGKIIR